MTQATSIAALYRYPVKGLSAERLASTRLRAGETIPADRLYAVENGPSGFDPAAPAYLPKLRFRGNLYVAGWPAWHEFSLLDREIRIGSAARVKIVKRIQRCAATEVDPLTAARDLPIPRTLLQSFGHGDCGVYAEVVADGEIAVGDAVAER